MKARWMLLVAGLMILALAPGAFAGCWCGNHYNDPSTNLVEAQVYQGDGDGMGTTTWMDFIYTTDGSDPYSFGIVLPGVFLKFEANNDWYQATIPANNGDLVRWFVEAQSADLEVCQSSEASYTSGYTPTVYPNLVGSCESELGLGGDWIPGDAASDLTVEAPPGVFSVTLTATADFPYGGGEGYQILGTSGVWPPTGTQYPGDGNIHIGFLNGETITFYLDTNSQPGWAPDANAPYDSKLISETHTWAAVGDWQSWDPTNPATQMTDMGGGIYGLIYNFSAAELGVGYQFKAAADGGWDLQVGVNGYSSNGSAWYFDVIDPGCVAFFVDTNTGRIMVDYTTGPSATENGTWGGIKTLYR